MAGAVITYRVVGRYMRGKETTGYHFIGSDDSSTQFSKERTIYLIGKGLVENMRIQSDGDEIVIRGKGVNLLSLPVYDESKQDYRNNQASQIVANSNVQPKKTSINNNMAQYTIIKRIMSKNNCIGYVVTDATGAQKKYNRDQVIRLGAEKRLSNAIVQKCADPTGRSSEPILMLRGAGVNLKELPILLIDNSGKIIDPAADRKEVVIRAARMKHSGVITCITTNAKRYFEVGDYIVIRADGKLGVIKGTEFIKNYVPDREHSEATCDHYLDGLKNYTVEIFGSSIMQLRPEQVKVWAMAKHI